MIPQVVFAQEWQEEKLSWPQDVSHEPNLKIGEVISLLNKEFPFLQASKIRYYESQNLLSVFRTASNQRLFSRADVERLRFILIEQRDRYVSLPQIKEQLNQLDSGRVKAEHPGKMRILKDAERFTVQAGTRLHKEELATLTGASIAQIEEFVDLGLISVDARGRLTSQAVDIVRCALHLEDLGFERRQLRAVKNSAHSHAADVVNLLGFEGPRGTSRGKERIIAQAAQMSSLLTNLYRSLLVENIEIEMR